MITLIALLMTLISIQARMLFDAAMLNTEDCTGRSILPETTFKLEPSDIVAFDSNSLLFVSDNGHLISIDLQGQLKNTWKVPGKPDLEALTLIPDRPGFVYLGQEMPPRILEFDLNKSQITGQWELDEYFDLRNLKAGLESMVYIPTIFRNFNGLMVVGRQDIGQLIVFGVRIDPGVKLEHIGSLDTLQKDLSAMTFWSDHLWLLYDSPKQMTSLSITELLNQIQGKPSEFRPSERIGTFTFQTRGQEGVAFIPPTTPGQETQVVLCVDPPKNNPTKKDIVVYPLKRFFSCFAQHGLASLREKRNSV